MDLEAEGMPIGTFFSARQGNKKKDGTCRFRAPSLDILMKVDSPDRGGTGFRL
jgi:hypothetical protein